MDVRKRVGLNLKRFRQELRLSQEAFAFKTGLHRTYISGIERGVRNPTVLVLEVIALALGVPSARLLEDLPPKRARR
jgi:transcriptional regulator with XRE-family HTH domain